MDPAIERFYPEIGQAALAVATDLDGRLIVYAEVEPGVVSADILYVNKEGIVRLRFCPRPLRHLIRDFWQAWRADPDNKEWRAMTYIIDGGKFRLEFTYPDQLVGEHAIERRPAVIQKFFGDRKVDYARPN